MNKIILLATLIYVMMLAFPAQAAAENCPAGQQPASPDGCSPCQKGTYKGSAESATCKGASPGYYVPDIGATAQTACPQGTYQSTNNSVSCLKCNAGTYNPMTGASSFAKCLNADSGYFVSQRGQAEQTPCPSGTYSQMSGRYECTRVSPGNRVANERRSQTPCQPGAYSAGGADTCTPADLGFYVPTYTATNQTACPAGTTSKETGWQACEEIDKGYYQPVHPGPQLKCPIGTYAPETGMTECLKADLGYYVSSEGAADQTACPIGYSSHGKGATKESDCIQCPVEGWTTSAANRKCHAPDNPQEYFDQWGAKAPGAKNESKCEEGKNWKTGKQKCT